MRSVTRPSPKTSKIKSTFLENVDGRPRGGRGCCVADGAMRGGRGCCAADGAAAWRTGLIRHICCLSDGAYQTYLLLIRSPAPSVRAPEPGERLQPRSDGLRRLFKYEEKDMPMKIDKIIHFEKRNQLRINVFGIEENSIYPSYVSSNRSNEEYN